MNKKRKSQIEEYYLQINRAHRNLKYMKYDHELCLDKEIKDPTKGLSFESEGELNMKMGINDFSAKEVINILSEKELEKIFKYFGEEKESKRIAHNIVEDRIKKKIRGDIVYILKFCGCNSVGRVSGCQSDCREFESRHPLHLYTTTYLNII